MSTQHEFEREVRQAIVTCLVRKELSLQKVGATLGLHSRTLQRRLARLGFTYQGLVDEVRLDVATSLLTLTDASLAEVAGRLGYADYPHFSRAFRRWTGLSPHAYRVVRPRGV